jgi:hypothetical protein
MNIGSENERKYYVSPTSALKVEMDIGIRKIIK